MKVKKHICVELKRLFPSGTSCMAGCWIQVSKLFSESRAPLQEKGNDGLDEDDDEGDEDGN